MAKTSSTMLKLGVQMPNFSLPDYRGKIIQSSDYENKIILIIFMCNHCPFVIHIREKLVSLIKEYQNKGVAVVGINANDGENYPEDSVDKMKEYAEKYQYSFPYVYDESQKVAQEFRAACTPDFFLFNTNHRLVYRGQMDASRPGNGIDVTGEDLRSALDALLHSDTIPEIQKPSIGCNIKWRKGNEPDYYG